MMRSWTALAVAAAAILAVAGCNDYGNTFQGNTGATITSISPSQWSAGNGGFTLSVFGGTFVKGTVIQWNGKTIPTVLPTDSLGNILGNIATANSFCGFGGQARRCQHQHAGPSLWRRAERPLQSDGI